MNMMTYRGYYGTVEYSAEDHCLYGKIAFIRDLVNYEATDIASLEKEFQSAVDDYLEDCEVQGVEPNKPFKGSFNVRIDPDLHRAAVIAAESAGMTLNSFVKHAIEREVSKTNIKTIVNDAGVDQVLSVDVMEFERKINDLFSLQLAQFERISEQKIQVLLTRHG